MAGAAGAVCCCGGEVGEGGEGGCASVTGSGRGAVVTALRGGRVRRAAEEVVGVVV